MNKIQGTMTHKSRISNKMLKREEEKFFKENKNFIKLHTNTPEVIEIFSNFNKSSAKNRNLVEQRNKHSKLITDTLIKNYVKSGETAQEFGKKHLPEYLKKVIGLMKRIH